MNLGTKPRPDLGGLKERYITLDPGDIVSTGTPAGIGPIKNGDIMCCTIERLGTLCNPVRYR